MIKIWLVWCLHCGKKATCASPPKSLDYAEKVNCVLCNRLIDASKGVFVYYKERIVKEEINLLSVE